MNVTFLDDHRQPGTQPERQPPASVEAEQGLLGAIIINGEAFHAVAGIVAPEHFVEEVHRRIFDVAGQLARSERAITFAALMAYLGDHEVQPGLSTRAYLARLVSEAVTVLNAPDYAKIVRDTAIRRDLIAASADLIDSAHDARVDAAPDEVAAGALERIREIIDRAPRQRTRFQMGEGMAALVERMERIRRGEERSRGIPTGFYDLDRALKGLQPKTIVVVAARVAMGKTVMMTNLAFNVARQGVGVLEISLEIPDDELQARHIAQAVYDHRKPLTFSEIQDAKDLDDFDAERVIEAQRAFLDLPLIAECPARMTVAEIAARIHVERKRMAARGVKLGVVLIDYLDKIAATDRYRGQRPMEIQDVMDALKAAARAEDVCIVLLAQVSRGTEGREDKRPGLMDLRSSGAIEHEAHAIVFVYRPSYYITKSAEFREGDAEAHAEFRRTQNDVELIIGKNRGGQETTVKLWGDVGCSYLTSTGYAP